MVMSNNEMARQAYNWIVAHQGLATVTNPFTVGNITIWQIPVGSQEALTLGVDEDISTTTSADTLYGYVTGVDGDTYKRFTITGSGLLSWGSGAAAGDIDFYRSAAGRLMMAAVANGAFTELNIEETSGTSAGNGNVTAQWNIFSVSKGADIEYFQIRALQTNSYEIASIADAAGVARPIVFKIDTVEKMRLSADGLTAAVGRTATYVVATSDAPAHVKAQADDTLTGTNDYIKLQSYIDLIEAAGQGILSIRGGTVALGATGIQVYQTSDVLIDFKDAVITYSGTGTAIGIVEDANDTQCWRCEIKGGWLVATGAAVNSATAIGVKLRQNKFSKIDLTVSEFRAGVAIQALSGANTGDYCETNRINAYIVDCKVGVDFAGSGGTGYNTIEYLGFDNYNSTSPIAIRANDAIGTDNLHVGNVNLWVHANDMTGLDLTKAPYFNIDHMTIESDTTQTGFIGIKTNSTAQRGHIGIISGGFRGKLFSLYGSAGVNDNLVTLKHWDIPGCNPNFDGVDVGLQGTNVIDNPDITTAVTDYTVSGGTLAFEAAGGHRDAGNLSFINPAADSDAWVYEIQKYYQPVQPGTVVYVVNYAKTALDNTQLRAGLILYDGAYGYLNDWYGDRYYIQAADGWSRLVWKFIVPDTARYIKAGILTQKPNNTDKLHLDDIRIYVDDSVNGYIAPGEIRTASGALTAGNANAIFFAWHNPEAQDILIRKVVIEITTPGGTALSVGQVGIADDATGTNIGTEFFPAAGIDLNAAAIRDSWLATDTGVQTKWVFCEDSAAATNGWVAGKILVANAASLVGRYYVEYAGR